MLRSALGEGGKLRSASEKGRVGERSRVLPSVDDPQELIAGLRIRRGGRGGFYAELAAELAVTSRASLSSRMTRGRMKMMSSVRDTEFWPCCGRRCREAAHRPGRHFRLVDRLALLNEPAQGERLAVEIATEVLTLRWRMVGESIPRWWS